MRIFMAVVILCGALVAQAQPEPELSLRVEGEVRQLMNLSVELGQGVTKAVRIYSQPSGRLLGVFTHDDGHEPFSRSAWFQEKFPAEARGNRFPAASFPFAPGAKITLQSLPAPATDYAIDVHVYGLWPTGNAAAPFEEREDKFTVATNSQKFKFKIKRLTTMTQLCCGGEDGGECGRVCVECTSNQSMSCCWDTDSECGWCGRITASCKRLICSTC